MVHKPPSFTYGDVLERRWSVNEADYSSSSVEVKNEWRYTSILHVPSGPANRQLNFEFCVKLIK